MPHHGNEEEHNSSREQSSKREAPVIRDHRKVDPVTGEARHPEGGQSASAADSAGDALAQAEEILNQVEVPAEEPVAQGTEVAAAAELKNERLGLQAEYVNYRKRVE